MANIRTRIETVLHDDIGASLSRIAVLGEVAQRAADGDESSSKTPLAEIAGISWELLIAPRVKRIVSGFRAVFAGLPEFGELLAHIPGDGASEAIQTNKPKSFYYVWFRMEPPAGVEPATC